MTLQEDLKQKAAYFAVDFIESGMVVGLGTGSTVRFALERMAEQIGRGRLKNVLGIPTSIQTEHLARRLGIVLTTLDDHPQIDLTIDGADEVDGHLNLIKGGGGALLREKIIAQASRRNIIIVHESKMSKRLGTQSVLPVEIIALAFRVTQQFLEKLGADVRLRRTRDGVPFRTDQNNLIVDAGFGPVADLRRLERQLNDRAGVVEHGLFIGLASDVIAAGTSGIRHLRSGSRPL